MSFFAEPIRSGRKVRGPHSVVAGLCRRTAYAALFALVSSAATAEMPSVTPSRMPRIGTVDERFQSYNIEMVEVTGGPFWKPYRPKPDAGPTPPHRPDVPGSADADLFQYRPPIDLANPKLRTLAAALGPAYLRVSGSWANTTYFTDSDMPAPLPSPGFTGALTRPQWRGVVSFARAVNAEIVTSFAAADRDAAGVWTPDRAERLLAYTGSIGGRMAAAEFVNEPDLAGVGGMPAAGYDAASYGRDFALFHSLIKSTSPETMILGPAAASESQAASDLLAASGQGVDGVSYHYYNAVSERCGVTTAPETALSEHWLSATDRALSFFAALRDRYAPNKPIWLTETADAACGGNPWAVTFVDTFRYLDQLGRLARSGVQVVMHNTLVGSDYGLLDEATLRPRPKYWSALLWRRLMGSVVLDPGAPVQPNLHVYAHCQRDVPGGVSLLVINADNAAHALKLSTASVRYALDAPQLSDREVRLNGNTLELKDGDELPALEGVPLAAETVTFAPATITFLAIPGAANGACR
jgi:Glycosyl hydrolase family 79, N-terminal domain